uniref:Nematode cuticle collagen N-terminal domain-containing protein n=1 Tax=Strongyloides stercoralis TaxID=6248 RepID=A0AAF5CVQ2_STRER
MEFPVRKYFNFSFSIISLTFITSLFSIIIIILNFFWIITTINEVTVIWKQFDNQIDEIKNIGNVQWSELNSFTVIVDRDVRENYKKFVKRYTEGKKNGIGKQNNRNRDYVEPDETYPTAPDMPINEFINEMPTTKAKYVNSKISYEGRMLSKVVRIQPKKSQCSCSDIPNLCKKGLPGLPGKKGLNGYDGMPGIAGVPGFNAISSFDVCQTMQTGCIACPPGKPGAPGAPGKRGVKGLKGTDGSAGCPGKHGIPGSPGEQGEPGLIGHQGTEGLQGPPGNPGYVVKAKPGAPGLKGPPGVEGLQGDDGDIGIPGKIGGVGLQGLPGLTGSPGMVGVDGKPGEPGQRGSPGEYCPCPDKSTNYVAPTDEKISSQKELIKNQGYSENYSEANTKTANVNAPDILKNNQNTYNINETVNYTITNDKSQFSQPYSSSMITDYNNTQTINQPLNNGMSSQNYTQTQIITETIYKPYDNINANVNANVNTFDNNNPNISSRILETTLENNKNQYTLENQNINNFDSSKNSNLDSSINTNLNKEDNSANKEYINKVIINTSQSSMYNSQIPSVNNPNISSTLPETNLENNKNQYTLENQNINNFDSSKNNNYNKEYVNKIITDTSQSSIYNSQIPPVQESISKSVNIETETETLNNLYQNNSNYGENLNENQEKQKIPIENNQNNYNKESSQQSSIVTNNNNNENENENNKFVEGTGMFNNNEYEGNGNNGKQTIIKKTIITETVNQGYPNEEYKLTNEQNNSNLTSKSTIINEIPSQIGYSKITITGYQTDESKANQQNDNIAPLPYQLPFTGPKVDTIHPPAIPQPNVFLEVNSGSANSSYYISQTNENPNKSILENSEYSKVNNLNEENATQQIQPSQVSHEENIEYERDFVPESNIEKQTDDLQGQLKNNKTYEAIKILETPTGEFLKSSKEKMMLSVTNNPSIKNIHHVSTSTFDNSPVERSKVNIGFLPQIKLIPYKHNNNITGVNNTIIREKITIETTSNNENKIDIKNLGPKIRLDKIAISLKKPGLIDGQANKSIEGKHLNISLLHEEKVSERARDSVDNKVLPEKIIHANFDLIKSLRKEQPNGDLNININGPNKIFIKAKDSIESLSESNFNSKLIEKNDDNVSGFELFSKLKNHPDPKNIELDIPGLKKVVTTNKNLVHNSDASSKNIKSTENNLEKKSNSEEYDLTKNDDKTAKIKSNSEKNNLNKTDSIKTIK